MPHFIIDLMGLPQTNPYGESPAWDMLSESSNSQSRRHEDANDVIRRSDSSMSDASADTNLEWERGSEPSDSASFTEPYHWIDQYAGHPKICPDLVTLIRRSPDFAYPVQQTNHALSALGERIIYTVHIDMGGSKWPGCEAEVLGAFETLYDANRAVVDKYMNYLVFPAEWIDKPLDVPGEISCSWSLNDDGALEMRHDDYRPRGGYVRLKTQCLYLNTVDNAQRRRTLLSQLREDLASSRL